MNSTLEGPNHERPRGRTRAWEALVDANPVLAKEILLTTRTRVYAGSVLASPILLAMLVLLVRYGMNRVLDSREGSVLLQVYFTGLAVLLTALGAILGSTIVVQDRESNTLEVLKFSRLGPRPIVLGKFAAVVLAQGAAVLCTLPLVAFIVSTTQVSVAEVLVAITIALGWGTMAASLGIAVSAHATQTRLSLLVSLLAGGVIGMGMFIWIALASELPPYEYSTGIARKYLAAPWNGQYLALLIVIPAWLFTTVLWLGYEVATAGLMDRSLDRSLPLKRWTLGTLGVGTLALLACAATLSQSDRDGLVGGATFATGALGVALIFVFAGEPISPTRRMQSQRPSLLSRVLCPPCLAPSIFFALVTTGVVLLAIPVLLHTSSEVQLDCAWASMVLATLGGFMGSIATRRGGARARTAGAVAVPLVFLLTLLHDGRTVTWVDAICPLWIRNGHVEDAGSVFRASVVGWAAAAFVSLSVMLRTIRKQTPARADSARTA
jgi:ABC-type transport system involved in multi-copper enzyme maturation permease subunit